ncbi:MAG: glutaredoxin family protein [Chloroflexi bacterium]|nr:glutaredoxin family protein [Chloroflexota bacterium]
MRVTLLERPGCGLCEEAYQALRRIGRRVRVDVERRVTDDARYALRVPVLRVGDAELDVAGLEDGAIERWLRAPS